MIFLILKMLGDKRRKIQRLRGRERCIKARVFVFGLEIKSDTFFWGGVGGGKGKRGGGMGFF